MTDDSIKQKLSRDLVRTIDAYVARGMSFDDAKALVKNQSVAGPEVWELVEQLLTARG